MLPETRIVAELYDAESGRAVTIESNAPGLQVYSGNFLEGVSGKDGVTYHKHQSVCLETQTYPDSVHHSAFPSPFLAPGQNYKHEIVYHLHTR
jgi:aldose 1-epimerase